MAPKKIKSKKLQKIKEVEDTKKKFSTSVLEKLFVTGIIAIVSWSFFKMLECKFNNCFLGGIGIGSSIVVISWLVVEHLRG